MPELSVYLAFKISSNITTSSPATARYSRLAIACANENGRPDARDGRAGDERPPTGRREHEHQQAAHEPERDAQARKDGSHLKASLRSTASSTSATSMSSRHICGSRQRRR